MKKSIIYLFSLLLFNRISAISAQEYKYFDISSSNQFSVYFTPKNLKESFYTKEGEKSTMGIYKLNKYYFDTFMPIYNEIFGFLNSTQYKSKDDLKFLLGIQCSFYFRGDFKPYYFWVSFPTNRIDEFPQWEEKLYRLCMKTLEVDVRSFIDIQGDKALFKGSTFQINMRNLYLFSESNLRLDDYNWKNTSE